MKKWKLLTSLTLALSMVVTAFPASNNTNTASAETAVLTDQEVETLYKQYTQSTNNSRVSVHDPSIVVGYYEGDTYTSKTTVYGVQNAAKTRKEIYFIFGSHLAFAYSTDLKNWKSFSNNITANSAGTIFETNANWSKRGDTAYVLASRWSSNLWAPDVTWNPDYGENGAWMMYMSVNGCSWNSSISLLTADSLNGNWTYRGTVIYSGFDNGTYSYEATDYKEVTGDTSLPNRYLARAYQWSDNNTKCAASSWNTAYGAHAIDPCIVSDGTNLWMTYGSWSGGIYMIRIDKKTGLRDRTLKYEYKKNASDPYMGYKIAGGDFASGEASYIQNIGGRYYLFISNGGLTAAGGYNMRVFSSDTITGPYKDLSGDDARYGKANSGYDKGTYSTFVNNEDNINGTVGNRLMSYYQWSFMDSGYVAQGHNSAFVDDDQKAYVVYHTRQTTTDEAFFVQVHQLFRAKNNGLVTAPFEYSGETLSDKAYPTDQVVGSYQILIMGDTNYSAKECVTEKNIRLLADGTVTGDQTGTWQQAADGPYVTVKLGTTTYQGVFVEQQIEGKNIPVMCLTLVGDNDISIWGYGNIRDDKMAVAKCSTEFSPEINDVTYTDIALPTTGTDEVKVSWSSSNPSVIAADGKLTLPATDTEVTLTATFERGGISHSRNYKTTVSAKGIDGFDTTQNLVADYNFDNDLTNARDSSQTGTLSSSGATKAVRETDTDRGNGVVHTYTGEGDSRSYVQFPNPLKGKSATGATVSLWVKPSENNVWNEIWSFFDNNKSRLFLTQNVYFGYNDGSTWFDCNNGATVTNALKIGQWAHVTVTFDKNTFAMYVDGELKYSKTNNAAYAGSSYNADMGQKLLNLINTANNFYLGYGAFWRSGNMSMDNLKIYSRALYTAEVKKLYDVEKNPSQEGPQDPNDDPDPIVEQRHPDPVGTIRTVGKLKYQILSNVGRTAAVYGVKSKKLTSATIGKTVQIGVYRYKITKVANNAFLKCTKLKSVVIGANVTTIGKRAFYNCKNLKTITIKTTKLTSVGQKALKGISKKAKIKVPSSKRKKYKKLLKKKGQPSTVKIK